MDMGGDLVHSVTNLEVTMQSCIHYYMYMYYVVYKVSSGFAVLTEQGVLMLLKHSADVSKIVCGITNVVLK